MNGKPQFYDLLRSRAPVYFAAFDLLWLDGQDLTKLPLIQRKATLRELLPNGMAYDIFYVDHINGRGIDLFHAACQMDLEGVVAKSKYAPYTLIRNHSSWVKIKNGSYLITDN